MRRKTLNIFRYTVSITVQYFNMTCENYILIKLIKYLDAKIFEKQQKKDDTIKIKLFISKSIKLIIFIVPHPCRILLRI